jgi:hypothetical protein
MTPSAAPVLPPSNAPWLVEVLGTLVCLAVAVALVRRWWRDGRPNTAALLFVGALTMFWQEFYADWGAYLYYNPDLALIPWGDTPFTTPNKPWYVIAGYGWFYAAALPGMLALLGWLRRKQPRMPYAASLVVAALIPFYLWNLITADALSFLTNWYQYLHPIGPSIHTAKGALPLLYPAFPFVLFAPLVVWSLDRRDDDGRTWFERLCGAQAEPKTGAAQLGQVGAWVVGMNLMYAATLTVPLVLVRVLFLPASSIVP